MEARAGGLDPTPPAWQRVADRFTNWRAAGSEEFYGALARHFAHLADHPVLPLHFEYAVTSNDRGRAAAGRLAGLLKGGGRRGFLRRRAPRVLDVGCAYGGFLVAFAERGAKVTGIEKDERYVRLAGLNLRERGLDGEVVHGDAAVRRPELRRRFELIIANDVLEHVERLDDFLDNVADWLAPGGVAYFEIPNGAWPPYVGRDGHHQLFGIALLDFAEASRYMALLSPGGKYDTYNYLGVADYRRLFAAHGLSFDVMPETLAAATVEGVLAQCGQLRAGLEAGLATVPGELAALVRERVEGVPRARRGGSAVRRPRAAGVPARLRAGALDGAREARVRRLAALVALALAAVLPACRKDPADAWRGMNVIWISFDSVRSDHCSFNGYRARDDAEPRRCSPPAARAFRARSRRRPTRCPRTPRC